MAYFGLLAFFLSGHFEFVVYTSQRQSLESFVKELLEPAVLFIKDVFENVSREFEYTIVYLNSYFLGEDFVYCFCDNILLSKDNKHIKDLRLEKLLS